MSCRQPIRISPLSAAAAEEAAGAEVLVEAVLEAAPAASGQAQSHTGGHNKGYNAFHSVFSLILCWFLWSARGAAGDGMCAGFASFFPVRRRTNREILPCLHRFYWFVIRFQVPVANVCNRE